MRSFVDFQLCTCKYVRRYSRLETICKRMEKIYLQNVSRLSSLCSDMDSMIQTDSDARISWKFSTDLWSGLRSEPKADFELSTSDGRTRSTGHSQDIQSVQEKENIAFIASQVFWFCYRLQEWDRSEPPMYPSHQRLVLHPGPWASPSKEIVGFFFQTELQLQLLLQLLLCCCKSRDFRMHRLHPRFLWGGQPTLCLSSPPRHRIRKSGSRGTYIYIYQIMYIYIYTEWPYAVCSRYVQQCTACLWTFVSTRKGKQQQLSAREGMSWNV